MKIPDKVRIGSMDYKIVQTEEPLYDGGLNLLGQIDYNMKTITIKKGVQHFQGECETLLHEIMHGITFERGFRYDECDEEHITDEVSKGWHQIIRDNPDLFVD